MKRFKLSTEVLFSEDAIDALLEEKDENLRRLAMVIYMYMREYLG